MLLFVMLEASETHHTGVNIELLLWLLFHIELYEG